MNCRPLPGQLHMNAWILLWPGWVFIIFRSFSWSTETKQYSTAVIFHLLALLTNHSLLHTHILPYPCIKATHHNNPITSCSPIQHLQFCIELIFDRPSESSMKVHLTLTHLLLTHLQLLMQLAHTSATMIATPRFALPLVTPEYTYIAHTVYYFHTVTFRLCFTESQDINVVPLHLMNHFLFFVLYWSYVPSHYPSHFAPFMADYGIFTRLVGCYTTKTSHLTWLLSIAILNHLLSFHILNFIAHVPFPTAIASAWLQSLNCEWLAK